MFVKLFLYVGEKYVLEKNLVFTNIQLFRQHPSPTLEQPEITLTLIESNPNPKWKLP